jgi:diguanylate cyclase (GGDEF)-like protein/PAS domain S-box-containing protein
VIDWRAEILEWAKSVIDGCFDPAVLFDHELTITHFNSAFIKLSGLRYHELKKRLKEDQSPLDLLSGPREKVQENAQLSLKSQKTIHLTNISIQNAAGEIFDIMQSFQPVFTKSGDHVGVMVFFRDMSAETNLHSQYKDMLAAEKVRSEELERKVAERTKQLSFALEEVTRLSRVDYLTGALNRRSFSESAEQALALARRHDRCVAILMCDLDYFKKLNDTYGHQAGDLVLVETVRALQRTARNSDKVGRFGGEEFVVLLAETERSSVVSVGERLCEAIRALPIATLVPGKETPQTISIGISLFPDHGDTLEALIGCADNALYEAKRSGRDRVVLFQQEPSPSVPRETHAEAQKEEKPRVLVVVSSKERGEEYRALLYPRYDVFSVVGGTDALSCCARQPFDAVLAAEDVSTENGIEFLNKSSSFLPAALRILLLESMDSHPLLKGMTLGGVDAVLPHKECPGHLADTIEDGLFRRMLIMKRDLHPGSVHSLNSTAVRALEEVITSRALRMVFQPIVDAASLRTVAYEALCRPQQPFFKNPLILFDAAFQLGSLWDLARIVREAIARDLSRFPDDVFFFINLHPAEVGESQLQNGEPCLLPWVERIVFEISERATISEMSLLQEHVALLKGQGYRIAIDDLGSGYSTLEALVKFSPSFLKIDISLIRDIERSPVQQRIVKSIVEFSKDSGIVVVAEGIEKESEASTVKALGCHLLQGFLYGKPKPVT